MGGQCTLPSAGTSSLQAFGDDVKSDCRLLVLKNVEEAGEYEVHILQGCGKGHGGSEVSIGVGKSVLTFTVEDTGHFQNFKPRNLGRIEVLKPGRQSLISDE